MELTYYKAEGKLSDIAQCSLVVYIPENAEEDAEVFSKQDFIDLAKGDEHLAEIIFSLCEWQSPYTVLDELLIEEEIEETETGYRILN